MIKNILEVVRSVNHFQRVNNTYRKEFEDASDMIHSSVYYPNENDSSQFYAAWKLLEETNKEAFEFEKEGFLEYTQTKTFEEFISVVSDKNFKQINDLLFIAMMAK